MGENKLEKPVFGLQDEAEIDPETEKKEVKELRKFADGAIKRKRERSAQEVAEMKARNKEVKDIRAKKIQNAQGNAEQSNKKHKNKSKGVKNEGEIQGKQMKRKRKAMKDE